MVGNEQENGPGPDEAGLRTAAASGRVAGPGRRRGSLVAVVVALFFMVQVALLVTVLRTNAEVAALREDIDARDTPALAAEGLVDLGSGPSSAADQSPAPGSDSSPTEPAGDLPRFLGGGADAALGRNLGVVAGLEYYRGDNLVIDSGDGVARAYMVWAHWCPFCQDELPMLAEWHEANAADFERFELISVTTAMSETADNPLVPYLDDSRFPFPVLVDADGTLAGQLGVNAFPFWVFTAPDGTVVGRAAGLIELEDLDAVFRQLEAAEPSTAMAVER